MYSSLIMNGGPAYVKTPEGYYKSQFIVLKNSELYIYSDKSSEVENMMLVLSPRVFVRVEPEIKVTDSQVSLLTDKPLTKVFAVILIIGGEFYTNQGIHKASMYDGDYRGRVTLFFKSQDTQLSWKHFFERATGNFQFSEYYKISEKRKHVRYNSYTN